MTQRDQQFARKLRSWASRIGQAQLPAVSTSEFVRQQLRFHGLDALVASLTPNKKSEQLRVPTA